MSGYTVLPPLAGESCSPSRRAGWGPAEALITMPSLPISFTIRARRMGSGSLSSLRGCPANTNSYWIKSRATVGSVCSSEQASSQSTLPVFQLQSRKATELTRVVGHQNQSVVQGDGSNLFPRTGLAAHAAIQAWNQRPGQRIPGASRSCPPRPQGSPV